MFQVTINAHSSIPMNTPMAYSSKFLTVYLESHFLVLRIIVLIVQIGLCPLHIIVRVPHVSQRISFVVSCPTDNQKLIDKTLKVQLLKNLTILTKSIAMYKDGRSLVLVEQEFNR